MDGEHRIVETQAPRCFLDLVKKRIIRNGEYNTNDHDLKSDYYEPILKIATKYDRSTGGFSVSGIKTLAESLTPFLRNHLILSTKRPIMRIVASHDVSEYDYDQIESGYRRRYSTSEEKLIAILEELKQSSDLELLRSVRNIGTMVKLGLLDIKIAVPMNKLRGRYHRKMGVFRDFDGHLITFEGSQNVSKSGDGSEVNLEGLVNFCTADPPIEEYKNAHLHFFEDLWDDKLKNVRVRELDKYPRELLASFGVSIDTIMGELGIHVRPPPIIPRQCQREAGLSWVKNGYRGIFEMCTGSGKSRAALLALEQLKEYPFVVVVTGNLTDLIDQWAEKEITQQFGIDGVHIIRISSGHGTRAKLEQRLKETIQDYKLGFYSEEGKRVFILAAIQSASQEWFRNVLRRLEPSKFAIIIDEVHHAGSLGPTGAVLDIDAKFRIGLSATWRRYDDDENWKLEDYFRGKDSPVAFSYSLANGIRDALLTPYQYNVHPVSLEPSDADEFRQRLSAYEEALRKIDPTLSLREGDAVLEKVPKGKWTKLLELRNAWRDTLNRAVAKTDMVLQIVEKEYLNLKKCIIYCASKQHLDRTSILMGRRYWEVEPYDSHVPKEVRKQIREEFALPYRGKPRFIGAIKCLDEGIDLPALDSAILAASNRTEREWIQRRGRILRRYPGKEFSVIHDLIMVPFSSENERFALSNYEQAYIDSELRRLETFASDASNKKEAIQKIREIKTLFGV